MRIRTIDDNFDYQMKKIIEKMREDYDELKDLEPEELEDKLVGEYAKEFACLVVERCICYSGDELFEKQDKY